jgi:outer membrane protein assembly factor BamD
MKFFFSIICFVLLGGCASEKPKGKTEAEVLYKEAKQLMEEERYLLATEKINQLKNQYPYSYYSTPAELMLADILFKQENFVESAAAYLLFRDFHPKHEKIPYVILQIAESYYLQLPDTDDRDLAPAVEAIKYYREVLTKYPNSKEIKKAKKKIKECQQRLDNKEKYVADFYFKTEVYQAALWRYQDILNNISNKQIRSHAMQRIIQSSYFMRKYKQCLDYGEQYLKALGKKDKVIANKTLTFCKNKI